MSGWWKERPCLKPTKERRHLYRRTGILGEERKVSNSIRGRFWAESDRAEDADGVAGGCIGKGVTVTIL